VDVVVCALGSQVKFGEETFVKIDKTYPLKAADIALNNKIPQYILVSSMGANAGSCLLYPRTKG
jgi:acetyl-CoA carboxylase carboxyltransferase component